MGFKRNALGRIGVILLLAVLAGLASPNNARAAAESTPRTMNFDGYLTDTGGAPLSGAKDMKFGLIVDTTRVWYAEYASVSVINGVFAVVLGDAAQGGISLDPSTGAPQAGTLLPISPSVLSTITSASVVTLEVEVYNGALFETLSPAYPVSAALFAIKADTVDGYDSTQLAKLDGSGNILSNNGTIVINNTGSWVGPSANIGSGGLTVTAGGAAITGNSNITGTLGVTSSLTAGSITTSGAMNASGKISATAAPTGTGVSNGSFYVNPASATLNNTLFGVAVNGTQKFRVDAEGDTAVGGDLTVTGTISGTVTNAGNATTVNGIGASTTATANMLFPLDSNAKFPNSVLYTGSGNSLDADRVDGFHASSTATDGYLYPLGVGNKFPNSVLNTGSGNGLDADTVDGIHASTAAEANKLLALDGSGKFPASVITTTGLDADTVDGLHAAAFGRLAASNTWSGATNAFSGITASTISASGQLACTAAPAGSTVADSSLYVNPATANANGAVLGVAVGGTQKFKVDAEGDAFVAGDLTVTGAFIGTVTSATNATNAGNADTVDSFHASSTPTASTILPLNAGGKFPNTVLNTGTGNGLDADTVDGIHASTTATANKLLALDGSGKFPGSVIDPTGLGSDTVDGFHASATAADGYLYPLGAGAKFPNSVLNTGTGGGLDADMVDGFHASDFVSISASNNFTGTTNTFKEVDISSGSVLKFLDGGSGTASIKNNAGTVQFLENDGATVACSISQAGVLTVAGGLTVSAGTISLPAESLTSAMITDRTIAAADINTGAITANEIANSTITATQIASGTVTGTQIADDSVAKADIATNAVTADKQFTFVTNSANSATLTADCPSGFIAISGGGDCSSGSTKTMVKSCPASTSGATACDTSGTAQQFWLIRCGSSNSGNQAWATCVKGT